MSGPAPVATVTLAEIYATQGHKKRALGMLDEVLSQEPDHEVARRLRRELSDEGARAPAVELVELVELVETNGEEIQTGQPPEVSEPEAPELETAPEPEPEPEPDLEAAPEPDPPADEPRLVLQQRAGGLDLYWELSAAALGRAGIELRSGCAVVRVVAFLPHGRTPQREERTLRLDADLERHGHGALHLDELGIPNAVRAAVGWESQGEFQPLAVGSLLEELSERTVGQDLWLRLGAAFP